jgi:hypothetical protein
MANDLTDLGADALSTLIHSRRVSCREVMQATLDRIHRVNPVFNAIVNLAPDDVLLAQADERDTELARGHSRGWLHGIPQAIKDIAPVAGFPTTQGSRLLAKNVPSADGLLAARMKAAGCIVVGRTNTPELGLGSHTFNELFGATRNAWDTASRRVAAAAARRWPWRSACCRWPTARTSWARCATPPAGTTCSACARRRAACRRRPSSTSGSTSWAPRGRWAARWRTSRGCCRCRPVTIRHCRCPCSPRSRGRRLWIRLPDCAA